MLGRTGAAGRARVANQPPGGPSHSDEPAPLVAYVRDDRADEQALPPTALRPNRPSESEATAPLAAHV
ncbi:hypothetical protein ACFTSF_01055 [Kribbella sp. NPDC056951]|uniref:hypothetical protein n=1 Tax=Kribbella sp. NPDC056951 TaxID=3345978 RepID=UPI0036317849